MHSILLGLALICSSAIAAPAAVTTIYPDKVHPVVVDSNAVIIDTPGEVHVIVNEIVTSVISACSAPTPVKGITAPAALPVKSTVTATIISSDLEPIPTYYKADSDSTFHPYQPGYTEHAHPTACAPQSSLTFYYAEPSATDKAVPSAIVTIPELTYPAVNAHLAESIVSVSCSANTARVEFNDIAAYNVALSTWNSTSPFTIVTFEDSCGTGTANGEHDFVLVKSILDVSADSLSIICSISIIDFEHAVGSDTCMTIELGSHGKGISSYLNANGTTTRHTPQSCTSEDYDDQLDSAAGQFIDLTNPTYWPRALPNNTVLNTTEIDYPELDNEMIFQRRVRRRDIIERQSVKDKRIVPLVVGYFFAPAPVKQKIKENLPTFIGNALDSVEDAALRALKVLDRWLTINRDIDAPVKFNKILQDTPSTPSPWEGRTAAKLYSDANIATYCVDCGATGNFQITGKIFASVAQGFKEGNINVAGDLKVGTYIGIEGQVSKSKTFYKDFVFITLGDAVLPGILKLGPHFRAGAGTTLTLDAQGKLLAGASLVWSNIQYVVDIIDGSKNTVNGFVPSFEPTFTADGQISVTVDGYVQAAVGFAIGLFTSKFSKKAEVINQSGLRIKAGTGASVELVNGVPKFDFGDCAGVSITGDIYNDVTANIFDLKKFDIKPWSTQLGSTCLGSTRTSTTEPTPEPTGGDDEPTPTEPEDPVTTDDADGTDNSPDTGADGEELSKRHTHMHRGIVHGVSRSAHARRQFTNDTTPLNVTIPDVGTDDLSGNSTDGVFSLMLTLDNEFQLHWSREGNIYAIATNSTSDDADSERAEDGEISLTDETALFGTTPFVTSDGTPRKPYIVGDAHQRAIHAYWDELDQYGVSRVRVHNRTAMPATSLVVGFGNFDNPDDGTDILLAVDTAGNLYYPTMCVYSSCYPKLFLVEDPFEGPTILQNLTHITGPDVVMCGYLPLNGNADNNGI